MKQYLMEGIGTFVLVLLVTLIANHAPAAQVPWAYGLTVAAVVYAGSNISGAHFNPAISLAELIRGGLERWDFPYYLAAQAAGGILGAILAVFVVRCGGTVEVPMRSYDGFCALFAEAVGAFALVFVFLSTAHSEIHKPFLGLAAGFAVAAAAFAVGNISPAAFNPVLVLGWAIAGKLPWGDIWPSLLGAFIGAAAGASAFRAVHT